MKISQPSSGAWLKPADHEGHLLLITKVHEIGLHFDSFKNTDVDKATFDYVDLDDPTQVLQTHVNNTHPGIVNKLNSALRSGDAVLGRIGKVPTDKGNPAWVLAPYDENSTDAQRAQAWIEQQAQPSIAQPAATPATPAQTQPAAASTSIDTSTLTDEQRQKLAAMGITT